MSRLQDDESAGGHHPGATLTITPAARAARRLAGPIAWSVLEDVVSAARLEAGQLKATTNVRAIAGHLDISKDTAARALRRLASLHLLEHAQPDRTTGGHFGMSIYKVDLTNLDGVVVSFEATPSRPRPRPRSRSAGQQPSQAQTSLFDLDGTGS